MWGCLQSSFTSVLVNGSPTKKFYAQKGLRQGDLTWFLFLVVAEGLSGMLREAKAKGLYPGVGIRGGDLKVLLLQFVDDIIFF